MKIEQILQQCKDEVAVKYGYSNYDHYLRAQNVNALGRRKIESVRDEAALLFAKKMCEKQREIDINNTGFTETTSEKLNSEEYSPFIASDDGKVYSIDKDSIRNAPLATEE